jgi:hypothetical protein
VIAWDPLSLNPYRLLGIPREAELPKSREEALVLVCPPLVPIPLTEDLFQSSLRALAEDPQLHSCLWFDSSRPLDQMAWLDIWEGRLQEAWCRWNSDDHQLSQHNLAILAHLRWLGRPEVEEVWQDCAGRYLRLAQESGGAAYLRVIDELNKWHHTQAHLLLRQGKAAQLQVCLRVIALLEGTDAVEQLQLEYLGAEVELWKLTLAQLRQRLLEGVSVAEVSQAFTEGAWKQTQFILSAVLPGTDLDGQLKEQLCLFYRLLARAWFDLAQPQAKDYGEAWMEKALGLAHPDKQAELHQELEHWKRSRQVGQARPAEMTLQAYVDPLPKRKRWLGGVLLVLTFLGLFWAFGRQRQAFPAWTRPAVQKRADQIANELAPMGARLAELDSQMGRSQGEHLERLRQERSELQQRHAHLKKELLKLQQWLDTH